MMQKIPIHKGVSQNVFSLSNPQCDSESDIDDKVRLNFLFSYAWKFPDSQNKNEFENNIFLQSSCQI